MLFQASYSLVPITQFAVKTLALLGVTLLAGSMLISRVYADVSSDVRAVQSEWAVANYQLQGDEKKKAFENLIEKVNQLTQKSPKAADLWVWSGIVKSSFAGVKGGLGALSLAKESRHDLEQALSIEPNVLQGSAYTSLGALYSKVPGWPVGFGSDKKAADMFAKALQLNPTGIDSNYFYAEFLADEGKYEEAEKYYLLAQQAPPRPDRALADEGRQLEIASGLEKVRKELHH